MPFKWQTENEIFFLLQPKATTAMTNQIHDSRGGVRWGKSEWVRATTRATTQEYGWEKKEKGFWQIDCQAETEMAQEHHKNKFAIIHFDLSLGKIGNCYGERQTVECVSRRRWVEAKFTFLFFFLLLSFRKKCFVSCLFFLCEANITE